MIIFNNCFDVVECCVTDRLISNDDDCDLLQFPMKMFSWMRRHEKIKTAESERHDIDQALVDKANGDKRVTEVVSGSMKLITTVKTDNLLGYKYSFQRREK